MGQAGEERALDELLPLVCGRLRALAASYYEGARGDTTLQPTALVHEAYLRLVRQSGAPAGSEVVSLDARGWPTAYETDDDGDGVVDYRVVVTLDANGNVALERYDAGADGVDDVVSRTEYDERGFVTRVEYDNDADGAVDMVFEQRNTYDEAGRIVREETDAGADGTIDTIRGYEWDAAGRLVATGGDADGDGVFEGSQRFVYDDTGRLVASSADLDPESDVVVHCTHEPPCEPCVPPLPAWRCPECASECVFVPRPPTGGLDP